MAINTQQPKVVLVVVFMIPINVIEFNWCRFTTPFSDAADFTLMTPFLKQPLFSLTVSCEFFPSSKRSNTMT